MIRVVMFDLGLTLVDADRRPLPHAKEAVAAINGFLTEDGKPLATCIVSDFDLASPATPAKVGELFQQYLEVLKATGFAELFAPPERRVTLSTHAGVMKPDRKVFEMALKRLKVKASLGDCLFITENAGHIAAARDKLGMKALQFGAPDFKDWVTGPALVAQCVAPDQPANQKAALAVQLGAKNVEMLSFEPARGDAAPRVLANCWQVISVSDIAGFDEVEVPIPVEVKVKRDARGALIAADVEAPTLEAVNEAKSFVKSLAAHGQIAGQSGQPALESGTYRITKGENGKPRLSRLRFQAR
jgi:hypothetical protein